MNVNWKKILRWFGVVVLVLSLIGTTVAYMVWKEIQFSKLEAEVSDLRSELAEYKQSNEEDLDSVRNGLSDVTEQSDQIASEQRRNLIGDCIIENIIRQAMGAEPINLEGCQAERRLWEEDFDSNSEQEIEPSSSVQGN